MPTILVTNDDGVRSVGLLALAKRLMDVGDVIILAPEGNRSASSHAKTMFMPLRVASVTLPDGIQAYSSSGSPTDCVALAAGGAIGPVPDLVVSGINSGYNLGVDITYSGTVACAMEATIKGIPGIAVSTGFYAAEEDPEENGIALAAETAAELAVEVMEKGLPPKTLLNINVPPLSIAAGAEIHITRTGNRHYPTDELLVRRDPWDQPYYWLGGAKAVDDANNGSDTAAVLNGCISITPVSLDMTNHAFMDVLAEWSTLKQPEL